MKKAMILSITRHTLTFVGGLLMAKGLIDEAAVSELVGGLMAITATIWGIIEKTQTING
jgi:hypothetical protein